MSGGAVKEDSSKLLHDATTILSLYFTPLSRGIHYTAIQLWCACVCPAIVSLGVLFIDLKSKFNEIVILLCLRVIDPL